MKANWEDQISSLFKKWVKDNVLPEVKRLKAYSLITGIDKEAPIRKGSKKGISGACVLVGISNHDECYGDFLEGQFGRGPNPIGVPVGEYVAELIDNFEEGSMNREMEEWRLDCIIEVQASLEKLRKKITARMPKE